MSNYIFGIKTRSGEHIDVSRTARGAKCYATRHGYRTVTVRNMHHYYVTEYATKSCSGGWGYCVNAENILAARTR
jgi:hypothetical protein